MAGFYKHSGESLGTIMTGISWPAELLNAHGKSWISLSLSHTHTQRTCQNVRELPAVTQLVKKLPASYRTKRFITMSRRVHHRTLY